jgi:hypothetical protein
MRLRLATRTARRPSCPRTQNPPRATPTAIPLSRGRCCILLFALCLTAPYATHPSRSQRRSACGILGPTCFSCVSAVAVDRWWCVYNLDKLSLSPEGECKLRLDLYLDKLSILSPEGERELKGKITVEQKDIVLGTITCNVRVRRP